MNPEFAELNAAVDSLIEERDKVDDLAADLSKSKKEIERLEEAVIPAIMERLELKSFVTSSGFNVAVKSKMQGRNLTANNAAALKWLRDNGQSGLISTTVTAPFGPGSASEADELIDRLAGEGIASTKGVFVNAASLKATVRRMLEEGKDVPTDLLGINLKDVAEIK